MPDYWELSFKTSMLSLHNRTIRSEVFEQICQRITFRLELTGIKRNSAGRLRPDASCVVYIVIGKTGILNFFQRKITGKLMNDRGYHFEMS